MEQKSLVGVLADTLPLAVRDDSFGQVAAHALRAGALQVFWIVFAIHNISLIKNDYEVFVMKQLKILRPNQPPPSVPSISDHILQTPDLR